MPSARSRRSLHALYIATVGAVGAVGILAAGCASTPPSHFYTLAATAAPVAGASPQTALSIAVGPVTLPALVDRPQIVISNGDNEVRLDEFNRWASPLQDNLARVVADNLAVSLATPQVRLFAQSAGNDAQYRVRIDVQRFVSTPGESVQIDALWSVRRMRDARTQDGRSTLSEAVQGKSYEALAAAHSRALERLSRDLATAVRSLED